MSGTTFLKLFSSFLFQSWLIKLKVLWWYSHLEYRFLCFDTYTIYFKKALAPGVNELRSVTQEKMIIWAPVCNFNGHQCVYYVNEMLNTKWSCAVGVILHSTQLTNPQFFHLLSHVNSGFGISSWKRRWSGVCVRWQPGIMWFELARSDQRNLSPFGSNCLQPRNCYSALGFQAGHFFHIWFWLSA